MSNKIRDREELAQIVSSLKEIGRRVVHTNGTYDILHSGHINTLEGAKSYGDVLVVSINSDESVKRLKGESRPIMDEGERARILAALEAVNFVTIFPEDDILPTLEFLKPNVHVKGGSFIPERVEEEKRLIESWGGEFVTLPRIEGKSTTGTIEKILGSIKK